MGVVLFVVIGALLRGIERVFPARDARGAPIRTRLVARERLTDVAHVVFNGLVTQKLVGVAALATFFAFVLAFGLPHDRSHLYDVWRHEARLAALPILLQAPLAIVFADLVGYWAHRAMHHGALWRLHVVHHSSRALDWLAGARNHPAGEAFATIATGAALLVVGFDPRVLVVAAPLRLYGILLHANVSFGRSFVRYVLVTPLFHRWHHAHPDVLPEGMKQGVNFGGLLPVWDLIFGTYFCPTAQPEAFGTDAPVPGAFVKQLVFPFRRDW
ncbi:MAG TPA: sterol desaturase family protein [Polyangiaceae bacterium]|jgi:sterol desaturase/sphingolipid hydroxylase (fatty acid hydroxylase superfamily)